MPTGVSTLFYLENQQPHQQLRLDNCYFQVVLHAVQGFYPSGLLARPGYLTVASSLTSSFDPDRTLKSLHQTTAIRGNTAAQVGLRTNLTEWLPARRTDSIIVNLRYLVTRDTPFRNLVDQMQQVGLVSKLSVIGPEMAVAAKVSEISGRLFSSLMREGTEQNVFNLNIELSLAELRPGYYVVFGSPQNIPRWPHKTAINQQGELVGEKHLIDSLNYTIIRILVQPRRGEERARGERWWELLQAARDKALAVRPSDHDARQKALEDWIYILPQVKKLAREATSYLMNEVLHYVGKADREVRMHLSPISLESALELPEPLRDVFGVQTESELDEFLREEEQAVMYSRELQAEYKNYLR